MSDREERSIQWVEKQLAGGGFADFRWIDPSELVVSQWVRVKCMYGCPEYGKNLSCPPNVPGVAECREFFSEYKRAALIHMVCEIPFEKRRQWDVATQEKLLDLEKRVFLHGYERAFLLSFDSCNLCPECPPLEEGCNYPIRRRPTIEAFAVDLFSSVRKFGYTLVVKKDHSEPTDRFALLLLE